jgi:hypothetical protein
MIHVILKFDVFRNGVHSMNRWQSWQPSHATKSLNLIWDDDQRGAAASSDLCPSAVMLPQQCYNHSTAASALRVVGQAYFRSPPLF